MRRAAAGRTLGRDRSGAAAIEFAFLAPLLFLLAMGAVQFGLTLNNYVILTEAVRIGARQLAVSRGGGTPYSGSVSAVQSAAPNLSTTTLTITVTVNGTACSTDTTCATALSGAQGQPASVSATYPCKLVVMGYDFAPSCTLSSQTTERIE